MSINLKKISIKNSLKNLVSYEDYVNNPKAYIANETAIEMNGYALPVVTPSAVELGEVGIAASTNTFIHRYNLPNENDKKEYMIEGNEKLVDFSGSSSYHEVIEKQNMVRNLENEILTNSDNITKFKIGDNNSPMMAGLKQGINAKECDIRSYEPRFDGNFLNDIRIMNEDDISLKKAVKFGNAMDMKIEVVISDKNDSVPNPMGKEIRFEITNGGK